MSLEGKVLLLLGAVAVLLLMLDSVRCFNVDVRNFARHRGANGSMFGFSVATHRERGVSWVLVGAPYAQNLQPGVRNGGAVFKCTIDNDDSCQEVPFDSRGPTEDFQSHEPIDKKSEQWFGATLYSAGEDKPIVACAPRYVYFNQKRERRDPVGTCYVSKDDFTSFSEYSPCRTNAHGYHRQGSCQAGFSAAISKDGRRLFIGGPGSWYWQGQMYSIDADAKFPFAPGKWGSFGSGVVYQQSLERRPAVVWTKEGTERDDDSYMGYSVTVGDFTGDGEQGVAVGMPRGAELFGKIVLFTWNLTNYHNITGLQLGAYFGYALAAADVDGDHTDDLIIGAPLHTEPNNEGKYEVGRVYIVYQGRDPSKRFRRLNTLDGRNSKSRFGLALASLGDINLDGFGDFAVGAPYDGPHERGAVYIYHGAKDIVDEKYTQVIYSEDVSPFGMPVSTFGFSISGGLDLDLNDYPDMAVGAYKSEAAFFFRSRPVIKIDAQVRFVTANKQIILDEKNCTLHTARQRVSCTVVDVCLKFSGVGVPSNINLNVQYILDSQKPKDPRMYFLQFEGRNSMNETVILHKDNRHVCQQKTVYIKNDVRDKLTPLEVEVRYSMRENTIHQQTILPRNPKNPLRPVLDTNNPLSRKDSISIHKNCGADNICVPNLKLVINSNVERYLLGSNSKLDFEVIVQNEGEDSFESTFDLQLPEGVDFIKINQYNKTEVRILCSSAENNTIRCDIGNPLPAGKIARFNILMSPYHKEGMRPSYDFVMTVNSTNPETSGTIFDNRIEKSIHIWVDSKLDLKGTSRPAEVHYNASLYTSEKISRESDIGPQVIHVYNIKNNGPSSINEAEMIFLWPYATLAGDDLLYLLEQPHILGNVKCEVAEANYRGYELEYRKKSIWETIGIDVAKGEFNAEQSSSSGIIVEEGKGAASSYAYDKATSTKHEGRFESGDASWVHQQRRKQQNAAASSGGTVVHVGEDTGTGSKVVETHTSSKWIFKEPDYTSNTIIHTSSGSSSGKSSFGTSSASAASGSGFTYTSSSSSSTASTVRPNIIYSSTGKQHGIDIGSTFSSSNGSFTEERKSGQQINITKAGGSTVYEAGHYPGHAASTTSKHFEWDQEQEAVTRRFEANYQHEQLELQRRLAEEAHRKQEEEIRRKQQEQLEAEYRRRIEEDTRRRTEEALRKKLIEEESIRRTAYTTGSPYDEEEIGRRRQLEEEHRRKQAAEEQRRRQQAEEEELRRRQHEEAYRRQQMEEARRRQQEDETRRLEEIKRRQEDQLRIEEIKKYEEELRRRQEEEYRRTSQHQYSQSGGSTQVHHHQYGELPYSEEEYYGSEENYGQTSQHQRNQSQSWSTGTIGSHSETNLADLSHGSNFETDYNKFGLGAAAINHRTFKTTGLDLGTLSAGSTAQRGDGSSTRWESHSESSWSASGTGSNMDHTTSSGRDNVATDKPDLNNRFRGKRQIKANDNNIDMKDIMECKATKCLMVRCIVGPLVKDQDATIALRSRVNVRTLRNITTSQPISFSSMMLARISKLPYIGTPLDRQVHSHEIFTSIPAPEPDIKPDVVPLWVIVLSAVGGTILLLLLIYLLHKLGFFKRNRPSDAPERQPLNRNGYYQNGDQAL